MTVLAITGGVGGAKLALGLTYVLQSDEVVFLVNTGDDFEHYGMHISPDIDTLLYTLGGLASGSQGWGREDETWRFMDELGQLNGETWFRLGDRDLAVHVFRTQRIREGRSLSEVTAELAKRFGVPNTVLPMSDDPVATIVHTCNAQLSFQHYFVRDRCEPVVKGFSFLGSEDAALNPALPLDDITGVVLCPSNPFVSIDPILALPGLRRWLSSPDLPVVAVSPIVGGDALKGPTAKMMRELGIACSALAVARRYEDFITGYILDQVDEAFVGSLESSGIHSHVTQTVMSTLQDRISLASEAVEFLRSLR